MHYRLFTGLISQLQSDFKLNLVCLSSSRLFPLLLLAYKYLCVTLYVWVVLDHIFMTTHLHQSLHHLIQYPILNFPQI